MSRQALDGQNDSARAYYAVVANASAGRPEVSDFVNWLKEDSKKEPR